MFQMLGGQTLGYPRAAEEMQRETGLEENFPLSESRKLALLITRLSCDDASVAVFTQAASGCPKNASRGFRRRMGI